MLTLSIPEGALFYGKTRRRVSVPFTPELRQTTLLAIHRLHVILNEKITPPSRYSAKRCRACSLLDLCLPRREGRPESVLHWFQENVRQMMVP